MFIHIGADYLIEENDILGVFDIETTTVSASTRDYLTAAQRGGRIINVSQDIPKTFVVCKSGGEITVYLSQYAGSTVLKRKVFS